MVRLNLHSFSLRGTFPPNTLSRLDQLRILSLANNSLVGPLPDLSPLFNLKSLFLSHNSFSGAFPSSLLFLHRLTVLDLAFNGFAGPIPFNLTELDRLYALKLEYNRFNGTVPPLNQSSLVVFNVSGNNLTGVIPLTPTLSRFGNSAFVLNPDLCGEVINKACDARKPFFDTNDTSPLGSPTEEGIVVIDSPSGKGHKKGRLVVALSLASVAVLVFVCCLICVFVFVRRSGNVRETKAVGDGDGGGDISYPEPCSGNVILEDRKMSNEVAVKKSGRLVFCGGENEELYSLEQLMRASAELLGRGSVGTTYKAVLDNQLIVTVKRLDANKTAVTSLEVFEQILDVVGGLRHGNLVPVRAYFQAKGERLVVYDYQHNGSLFNLIHGMYFTMSLYIYINQMCCI